ncbi:MAG: response regulator [Deltaproteobacteria bacterium]|nr:response regulator [Deltaproteobacteria bacterium]
MPCILTVDDSRAIRMIVSRVVQEMGFEVDEAEDGLQGLSHLEEMEYALVVLDVTMPNLDGPGMLAKMREAGNATPVLMLTSESKRSIIADVMKNKIEDYILKPFKNDELKAKILKILKQKDPGILSSLGTAQPEPSRGVSSSEREAMGVSAASPDAGARQFGDILVIDDMENVAKKLRTLIPQHFSLSTALNGQAGLKICREKTFRLILIDRELPDVQGAVLLKQLRVLQPGTACFAMALKSSNNLAQEVKDEGFDDLLAKPFTGEAVDEMLGRFFDGQELVTREENVLAVSAFVGKEDRLDRYFTRVKRLMKDSVQEIAEACFETIIIDATKMPVDMQRNVQVVQELAEASKKLGLSVCLVGPAEIKKSLELFEETAGVQVYSTLSEARASMDA